MTNGNHPHKSPTLSATPKSDQRQSAAKEAMNAAGTARPTAAKGDAKQPARVS